MGWQAVTRAAGHSGHGHDRRHKRITKPSSLLPLLLALLLALVSWPGAAQAMRPDRVTALRRETVNMFYHGFDNYMEIAFPEDELRPVTCGPLTRDNLNPRNLELNDVLGNYSLTLIDSLSTLAILASAPPEDGDTGPKALRDFQDGVEALVLQYGDGRPGPSGAGQRGRGFDVDSKVQVFETVIRGVGGLLSAHLFAIGELPITGYAPPDPPAHPDEQQQLIVWPSGFRYDGQLLRLALDLATRLLPAFYTPTGMPYPRVNLRHGIPFYVNSPLHGGVDSNSVDDSGRRKVSGPAEVTETCSAGAGSLVLEFTVLSRLTGDQRFEQLAKRAFWAVWYRRSDIGLIGAGVDAEQGRWIGTYSVIGAGADSFFEYALKTHILLSGHEMPNRTHAQPPPLSVESWHDPNAMFPILSEAENSPDSFLGAWHLAHAAIKRHLYSDREHPHYVNVNLWTGSLAAQWIDSLGAYYSGLLTLAGELKEAIETNLLYTAIWARYAALPERWSVKDRVVEGGLGWWPLRPEFIESVYHIYRATQDPWYLYVGEMVQRDIRRRCWTECGWAGLQNVLSGEMTDRMESFFLGETAKYMYLLYDDRHPLNSLDAAYVFTTEGHPLIIPTKRHHHTSGDCDSNTTKKSIHDTTTKRTQQQSKENEDVEEPVQTATQPHSGIPGVPEAAEPSSTSETDEVGLYNDDGFTNVCPLPPRREPLTGSAVTARGDVYHAAKMVDLHLNMPDSESLEQTFFPWTLPPSMLPSNGTSAKVQQPMEMSLEFSAQPAEAGGGGGSTIAPLGRIAPDKIRVNSISSLKLIFRLEEHHGDRAWRVTRVNGVPLGRDESIVMDRALISHIQDPRFATVRDPIVVKLHHLHHVVWQQDNQTDVPVVVVLNDDDDDDDDESGHDGEPQPPQQFLSAPPQSATSGLATLVKSFWRQIVSSLDGPAHATPAPGESRRQYSSSSTGSSTPLNVVLNATGVTPTGLGVAALPSVDTPAAAVFPAAGPVAHGLLPWSTAYAGGYACNSDGDGSSNPLPEAAVRDHQVLVLRRGGCSFSEKLSNVPSFAASPRRLQLVVVVSDDDDVRVASSGGPPRPMTFHDDPQDFVRPLLDDTQRTPSGLARWHPLAMIMVGGGEEAYRQIAEGRQFGLTRRYGVESQGVRIRNVILDDGDEV